MDEKLSFQVELDRHDCRSVWELICSLRLKRQADSPRPGPKYKSQKVSGRGWRDNHRSANNPLE